MAMRYGLTGIAWNANLCSASLEPIALLQFVQFVASKLNLRALRVLRGSNMIGTLAPNVCYSIQTE